MAGLGSILSVVAGVVMIATGYGVVAGAAGHFRLRPVVLQAVLADTEQQDADGLAVALHETGLKIGFCFIHTPGKLGVTLILSIIMPSLVG